MNRNKPGQNEVSKDEQIPALTRLSSFSIEKRQMPNADVFTLTQVYSLAFSET
jgi:hypothetical protein